MGLSSRDSSSVRSHAAGIKQSYVCGATIAVGRGLAPRRAYSRVLDSCFPRLARRNERSSAGGSIARVNGAKVQLSSSSIWLRPELIEPRILAMTRLITIDDPINVPAVTAIHPQTVMRIGIGSGPPFPESRGLFEDSVAVDIDPQALRKAVVPLDQDLELVGVVDSSSKADARSGPKELDSVTLARDPAQPLSSVSSVVHLCWDRQCRRPS
jgi:hypothetical protein